MLEGTPSAFKTHELAGFQSNGLANSYDLSALNGRNREACVRSADVCRDNLLHHLSAFELCIWVLTLSLEWIVSARIPNRIKERRIRTSF